nr:unnamed protein product [Spirometra erinaceieuropaei]
MVPKATSGDLRPCGDYRALNSATIPDQYPVPHLQDFAGAHFGKSVFSKIDLVRAFHQMPVAHEDIPKTAVTTPFGLFELLRMQFGLHYAAQTFQRTINHVLRCLPHVYAYIYDLLVASRNEEEHEEHFVLLFDGLDKFGVVINPSKSVLGMPSLEFFGHQVDPEGFCPLPSKVNAVRYLSPPTSKRQLQRFLGIVNFYHRFLSNCADLMLPLTNMLSGSKGPIKLTGEALIAFERIKNSLVDDNLPSHPAPEAQLPLMVDASTVAAETIVKAVLSRWVAMFGVPSTVTSDHGAQFESVLFQTLLNFLGCTGIRTTAYHIADNGMVERFHRLLKTALHAIEDPGNWSDNLPLALLGIRAALKSDLGRSAAGLLFGTTPRLPGELVTPTSRGAVSPNNFELRLRQFMRLPSPVTPRTPVTESYTEKDLDNCTHVFVLCDRVCQPLESLCKGPFRVLARNVKVCRILCGDKEDVSVPAKKLISTECDFGIQDFGLEPSLCDRNDIRLRIC